MWIFVILQADKLRPIIERISSQGDARLRTTVRGFLLQKKRENNIV